MTLREFQNRYWYAADLRDYAVNIGIPAAKRLRKDELQRAAAGPPLHRAEPHAALHADPYDCYVNFLADFHAANTDATRAEGLAAWKQLKTLDVPKNYASWVKANRRAGRPV